MVLTILFKILQYIFCNNIGEKDTTLSSSILFYDRPQITTRIKIPHSHYIYIPYHRSIKSVAPQWVAICKFYRYTSKASL
jgi:hypothetical protein